MNVLGNLQSLKEKNFWLSIVGTDIDNIRPAIAQWEEEQKYTNELLQFFSELSSFNYTEKDISFYNQNLKDFLSSEECGLLFKNIDKIENRYIKVLLLGFFWQYKKLRTQKENFNAVLRSLELYLEIIDSIFQKFKKEHDINGATYLVHVLTYCLYMSAAIQSPLHDDFVAKTRGLANLEYTKDNLHLIRSAIELLIKHSTLTETGLYLTKLEKLLQDTEGKYVQQEALYNTAILAAKRLDNKTKVKEFRAHKAEMFEREAREEKDIHREVWLLRRAANIYINLPTFKEKWKSLSQEIEQKSPRLLDALVPIQFEYKANREYINRSIQAVSNKSLRECLKELAKCINILPFEKQIEEMRAKEGILSDIFASTVLDEKGFVSATISDKNKHPMSFYTALKFYWFAICIHCINPMLSRINQEHFFTYQDMIPFCTDNPFIPEGRIEIFAKGLYYFLKQDMMTSAALLVPQLENSFRHILYGLELITKSHQAGKQEYKIELQWFLNTLLERKWIGNKMFFNLEMLLCDDSFNIRNELAHGLLSDSRCDQADVMVLNWCIFFFAFDHLIREDLQSTK